MLKELSRHSQLRTFGGKIELFTFTWRPLKNPPIEGSADDSGVSPAPVAFPNFLSPRDFPLLYVYGRVTRSNVFPILAYHSRDASPQ